MKKIVLLLAVLVSLSSLSPSKSYSKTPVIINKNLKIKVGDNIYSFFSKTQIEEMFKNALKDDNARLNIIKFQNSNKKLLNSLCFGIYNTDDNLCYINLKQGKSMADVVTVKRNLMERYAYLYDCDTGTIYSLQQIS